MPNTRIFSDISQDDLIKIERLLENILINIDGIAGRKAILKNAGGAVTNIDNQELSYGKNNFEQGGIIIASSNKLIHERICLEIKEIIKENNIYPLLQA